MKALELHKLNARELDEKLDEAKEELFNLRFQLATNQLDNTRESVRSSVRSPASRRCSASKTIAAWERLQEEG